MDPLDLTALCNGLVFFAPVALLVRSTAGVSTEQFFVLQALLSAVVLAAGGPFRLADRPHRLPAHSGAVPADNLGAKGLLLAAWHLHSLPLFVLEAVVEGLGSSLASGTRSAYLYRHPAAGAVPDPARSGGQLGDGGLPGQYRGVWGALPLGWAGAAAGGHHRGQRSGGGRSFPPAAGAALPGGTAGPVGPGAWGWGSCCVPGRWRH